MSSTYKIVLLIFDILVSLPFLASNWWVWSYLSGKVTTNVWGPLQIYVVPQIISGGQAYAVGPAVPIPNYPFILFWVALAGNFILFILALRSNNKKQRKTAVE